MKPIPDSEDPNVLIEWMLAEGLLAYHPDDLHKPPPDRRLVKTAAGERHQRQIEARLGQRDNAHLS